MRSFLTGLLFAEHTLTVLLLHTRLSEGGLGIQQWPDKASWVSLWIPVTEPNLKVIKYVMKKEAMCSLIKWDSRERSELSDMTKWFLQVLVGDKLTWLKDGEQIKKLKCLFRVLIKCNRQNLKGQVDLCN